MYARSVLCSILLVLCSFSTVYAQKVACVGDSITYGSGIANRMRDAYPAQLEQYLLQLDSTWEVGNYGVSGATLLRRGDKPYMVQSAYTQARSWEPDLVVIMLGTNDSKEWNWVHSADFVDDYLLLIDRFQQLPSHPQVWICKPVPAFLFNFGISDEVIRDEVGPLVDEIAALRDVRVIDLYTPLLDAGSLFPDGIHPDAAGSKRMVDVVGPFVSGIRHTPEFNQDGMVNFQDFAALMQNYQFDSNDANGLGLEERYDLTPVPDGDERVTMGDLSGFLRYWLRTAQRVAKWPLDETEGLIAHDLTGDFPGTVFGEAQWDPEGGISHGALTLDGINDTLDLGSVINPADGPFTVLFWVQGGSPGEVLLSQESTSQWIATDPVSGSLQIDITKGGSRGSRALKSDFVMAADQWVELRLVWDGAQRYLFVDNQEIIRDVTADNTLPATQANLLFGSGKDQSAESFWTGRVDDIRIYKSALLPE